MAEPQTKKQPAEENPDEVLLWMLAAIGVALTVFCAFVFYQTLQIFAQGTTAWFDCINGQQGALLSCGEGVDLAYDYRAGFSALNAMSLALVGLFIGPIPLIFILNRYRNSFVSIMLFFIVVIPYGLLAFLVVIIGLIVVIFYGSQFVL